MELEDVLRRRRVTQPLGMLLGQVPTLAGPATPPFVPTSEGLGPPPPVPVFNPTGVPAPGGPVSTVPPSVHIGQQVPADASNLQRLMAQHVALSQASPASQVKRTSWGYEELPPEQSPSRLRHAGMGAAQGAILAGQATKGDPWGTLAGAAVGALTGGVSPALIQAFQRRQELDQSTGDLATEQSLQLHNAQIGETLAQAEQRRLEPYLKAEELRAQNERFEATEKGRNERATATESGRSARAAEANKQRQLTFEETARHNKAMEGRPTGSDEKIVNNAIYRKDKEGVYRLAPGSPAPISPSELSRAEREGVRATERVEKGKQAEALYQKGAEYWDQAKQKREEAHRLGLGPDGQPSRVAASRNEDAIKRLTREAENLENKTRDVQVKGDMLAAESGSGQSSQSGDSGGGGKAFDLARWKRDHPGADPSAVIKRAKDARMRIIE